MTDGSTNYVTGVSYGVAGELLSISGAHNETRSYNARLQLTGMNGTTYSYSSTQNNGKIQSETTSGETITYAYDSLNRLISATSNQGWGQGFGYDGFGNLTQKTALSGSVPTFSAGNSSSTLLTEVDFSGQTERDRLPYSG